MGKIINGSQLGIKVVAESKKEYSDSDYDKVFDFSKEWVNSFRKSHGVASNFDYADLREAVVKKFGYTDFTNEKLNSAIQEGWGEAEQDVELKTEGSVKSITSIICNIAKDLDLPLEDISSAENSYDRKKELLSKICSDSDIDILLKDKKVNDMLDKALLAQHQLTEITTWFSKKFIEIANNYNGNVQVLKMSLKSK